MIDKSIFDRMDAVVEEAGPRPEDVAQHFKATVHPAYGSINGMLTIVTGRPRIALNNNQPDYQYLLAYWHELAHLVEGHYKMQGFFSMGIHCDTDSFSAGFATRITAYTEKISNLVAADRYFKSKNSNILKMSGYYALESIREAQKDLQRAQQRIMEVRDSLQYSSSAMLKYRYSEAKRELREDYDRLMDLSSEISDGDFMTIPQIAAYHGVPEHYVEYALEAYRLRGADVDVQVLRSFEKVFTKGSKAAGLEW